MRPNVRYGSEADLTATNANVRLVPEADIAARNAFLQRVLR